MGAKGKGAVGVVAVGLVLALLGAVLVVTSLGGGTSHKSAAVARPRPTTPPSAAKASAPAPATTVPQTILHRHIDRDGHLDLERVALH